MHTVQFTGLYIFNACIIFFSRRVNNGWVCTKEDVHNYTTTHLTALFITYTLTSLHLLQAECLLTPPSDYGAWRIVRL